jgi:kynureninase
MEPITRAAREAGAVVGWDLAHAAGNVPTRLHDWNVDFAAWCSYKYLNAGPGAVAGAFVHERHAKNTDLPRFAGWWGNDPAVRFQMRPDFVPREGADGWQLSNPPILSMAPLKTSLAIFQEAGMSALRVKSTQLTGYLEFLLSRLGERVQQITPRDPAQRGCHLSLTFRGDARAVLASLKERGVACDFREPNILRAAPTPLYNTFHDVWKFAQILEGCLR